MNWLFLKEMSSNLKNLYWCYSESYSLKVFLLWWGWLWLRERGFLLDYEWFLSLLMSLRGLFPQCSPSSSGSPSGVYLHPHNQPRRLLFICLSPFSPISSLSILHPFFFGRLTVAWQPARMKEMCNGGRKEEKDESKAKSHPRLPGPTWSSWGVQFHHAISVVGLISAVGQKPKSSQGRAFSLI